MTRNFLTDIIGARWRPYALAVLYALAVFAPLYLIHLVIKYGVDVPFWDQWEFVPLWMKYRAGALTFHDLWAQHNEHRILFPKLIMLGLASATGWDIRYELYAGVVIAALTFVLLNLIFRRSAGRFSPWFSAVSALLIFSPAQHENWTWGWQIQIFLVVLGAVAAVWAIDRWPGSWGGLAVAVCAATVGTYSFSNGLLAWPVVWVLMVAQGRWKARHIAAWTAAFVISAFLYYHDYIKPGLHPSLLYPLSHPYDYIRYVLVYLGSPLALSKMERAVVAGIILSLVLCVATIRLWRSGGQRFESALPWLALALYSMTSAAVTGIGRLGFGVGQAMSGRYITISTPFAVSVSVVAALWLGDVIRRRGRLGPGLQAAAFLVSILLIFSYAVSFSKGVKTFARSSEGRQRAKLCLKDAAAADDECLKILYPDAAILRERAGMLADMGIFKWVDAPPAPGKDASMPR